MCLREGDLIVSDMSQTVSRWASPVERVVKMRRPCLFPLLRCESAHTEISGPGVAILTMLEGDQIASGIVVICFGIGACMIWRIVLIRRTMIPQVEACPVVVGPGARCGNIAALTTRRCPQAVNCIVGELAVERICSLGSVDHSASRCAVVDGGDVAHEVVLVCEVLQR